MLSTQTPYLINWFVWLVRTADSVDARLCMRVSAEGAGSVRLVHRIAALMGTHRSTAAILSPFSTTEGATFILGTYLTADCPEAPRNLAL